MQTPQSILENVFGYRDFRPGQADIIDGIMRGDNILAVLPTGAGKSLCYQIPALLSDRPAIIVSPLKSLMDNQTFALRQNGIDVACIHSGQSRDENIRQWKSVTSGQAKMLYLSPEQLMTERMLAAMEKLKPSLFVIDEAHCVAKWGPDFREDYARLTQLHQRFPDMPIAAFTATADKATREEIADVLFSGQGKIVVHGFDRPNLSLAVTTQGTRKAALLEFMKTTEGASGIVYALSRRNTEDITEELRSAGYKALTYHAGMEDHDRSDVLNRFLTEDGIIVVATIAFGMGIDKPDIRFVYHASLPSSMEAYYQEIGRAGRDGQPAETVLYYTARDVMQRSRFIADGNGSQDYKIRERKRLEALLAYCEAPKCRRQVLLDYFGDDSTPCGNCDNCQNPPDLIDATEQLRILLGAIEATGGRFGQGHVIDVARGKVTDKGQSKGHDKLEQFGQLKHMAEPFLKALIRQAIATSFIDMDIERMGALKPTDRGRAVLTGDMKFECKDFKTPTRKTINRRRGQPSPIDLKPEDQSLLGKLKAKRLELAREADKPAFTVFTDATLMDMVRRKPQTLDDLLQVNGVGPSKLERFGAVFLEIVQAD